MRKWQFLFNVAMLVGIFTAGAIGNAIAREDVPSIPMLSGGVGADELEAVQSEKARFNVRVLFSETGGAYVSDVKVSLLNKKGEEIAATQSEGPILLIRLKPGSYTIKASVSGATKTQKFTVPAKEPVRVHVAFPLKDNMD